MSRSSTIAAGGLAIGQGLRERREKKKERQRLETRLGTIEELAERKDDFADLSLSQLQGLEDSIIMKRANELQKQQAEQRQAQLQMLQQQLAAMPQQQQRQQEAHALNMQLGQKQLQPPAPPGAAEEILPGVYRAPLGHGNHSLINLNKEGKPPPGFDPVQLPNGEQGFVPNFNPNSMLTKEGKKFFENQGPDFAAQIAALLGGQAPAGGGAASRPQLSAEDQQAIQWAKANPNDPRAQAILKKHGL